MFLHFRSEFRMSDLSTIRLKPRKALPFFCRHPWVFEGAIQSVSGHPVVGAEVRLESSEGQFIARGLYNPGSKIRVRLYSWQDRPLDEEFWRTRIEQAVGLRRQLAGSQATATSGERLIFSEGDGISGLTVDRYGHWLLTQWTSAALAERRELLISILQQVVQPRGIWRRTERGIGDLEGLSAVDGLAVGEEPPRPLEIVENDLVYEVDVIEGQKTGFYFDQRDNRLAVARYAAGARVLDICTYTGSFAMNVLKHGNAADVLAVDSSRPALELAARNVARNGLGDRVIFEASDAFDKLEALAAAGEKFDLVVLDPPKLARSRGGMQRAIKGYIRMNRLGMQVLRSGGILATCSCSGQLSRTDFEQVVVQAAQQAHCEVQILEQRGQAPDHPVSAHCLETNYLKCFICRVHHDG